MELCLQECVVHVADDYVVVHKPAGVQVAPTVDNLLENVLACTAQVPSPLLPAHLPSTLCLHDCAEQPTLSAHM